MTKAFGELLKQPYWTVALIFGAAFDAGPCLTVDKTYDWEMHPPTTYWPIGIGLGLLIISTLAFGYSLWSQHRAEQSDASSGVDLARVKERKGALSTKVSGCEIRVVSGRIETYDGASGHAIVLPCNEYFDDRCVDDTRGALGAYANRVFEGQVQRFLSLMKEECRKKLGRGSEQQKTEDERAESFGVGRCVILSRPLGKSVPIALLSTTTQRSGEGLSSRISYLFSGMRELVARLADERINEVAMPLLGSGHGGLDPPLALVGLLGAIAEAARYGQGAQRLRAVTIILFKRDAESPDQVDPVVVRRALALIGSRD